MDPRQYSSLGTPVRPAEASAGAAASGMLQAFVDESGYGGDSALVMGGFISTPDKWAAFSVEWRELLNYYRPISYFKMSEAANLRGEFLGWSPEIRDEKVALLWKVIARHIIGGVYSIVPVAPYREIIEPTRYWQSIYQYSVFNMVLHFTLHQHEQGLSEPIDYVFDDTSHKREILDLWDEYKYGSFIDPKMIGSNPIFRDEKSALPLQAADLIAWIARRQYEERMNEGLPKFRLPELGWTTPTVQVHHFYMSRDAMKEHALSIYRRLARRSLGLSGYFSS